MRIKTLRLENFQGIKSATFDFDGKSASIYGENGTGKTTVFNAVTWLLFDKPSTGAKNYTPKTNGSVGYLHHLDHAAEAQFIMDDGRLLTLRKVFHENYKKKRGSPTEEFDGHSVDFFIDGVPVKEREYTSSLLKLCGGLERMKMLTMPNYFAEDMSWDDRRKILLEVCGDISDEDVIASDKSLKELGKFLLIPGTAQQFYSVEEYKKIAVAKKSDINKQLQGIPGRIDEAQRAIPEDTFDVAAIEKKLAELQAKHDELSRKKAGILAGDTSVSSARKRTADAEAALAEARTAHTRKVSEANQSVYAAISTVQDRIAEARSRKDDALRNAEQANRDADRMETCREELLREYAVVQADIWDESRAICPTCHRELPAEEVSRMREEFNVRKSNHLQAINEKGRQEASKTAIAELRQKSVRFQTEADVASSDIQNLSQDKMDLEKKLMAIPQFENTEEYARLFAAVSSCRAAEMNIGSGISEAVEAVNGEIEEVNAQARRLQQDKGKADLADIQRKRIKELENKEKDLSAEYEELDRGLYLCDLFTKAKVRMLTDRINGKFKTVRFRLFIEQQNGGVKDDCEVLVPGEGNRMVPYPFANHAARVNAGLEIIGALSFHWHISMPVFIDNAESVIRLLPTDTQTIRLVVSDGDVKLRTKLADEASITVNAA